MNKTELINAIAEKAELSKKDADKAVSILRANGEDAYVMGEIVESDVKITIC